MTANSEEHMTFKERVYLEVRAIPYGHVATYGQIALLAGYPGAARAVGNALHRNDDVGETPCYRVVNAEGHLAEHYGIGGIEMQKQLLESEGVEVINYRVDLGKYGM